jgi:hypothetical protein
LRSFSNANRFSWTGKLISCQKQAPRCGAYLSNAFGLVVPEKREQQDDRQRYAENHNNAPRPKPMIFLLYILHDEETM